MRGEIVGWWPAERDTGSILVWERGSCLRKGGEVVSSVWLQILVVVLCTDSQSRGISAAARGARKDWGAVQLTQLKIYGRYV